ncbi:iron complex outermembrane receptor protein [Thermonema lapsum]|uniref:Iron complex outermembrane receptor protein n=1 Tax=Thermonema lapsum TaxID=28195 RepID=A0A846MSQ8_9BACT|nr:TonB-dependent receptor [Thermonema lapsum]NIK74664.1 iron complex outermembrane receptor protein [Thermonema lapsum]
MPHYKEFLWACLYLCLHAWSSKAQDCMLRLDGRVIDTNGKPLPAATVYILNSKQGSITSSDGYYRLEKLCPGQYVIEISFTGYSTLYDTLQLTSSMHRNYRLSELPLDVGKVVIESKPFLYESVVVETLNDKAQWRQASKPLSRMLEEIEGVSSLSTGAEIAQPMLHGFWGNRLALNVEGSPLGSQRWGAEHAPEIDPLAYDRIEVIKGAQAVLLGSDAIGGAVVVKQSPLSDIDSLQIRCILNTYSNGMGALVHQKTSGRLSENFTFRIYTTATSSGDRQAARYVLSNTGHRRLSAGTGLGYRYRRWDANVQYDFFGAENGILRAAHIGNLDDLARAMERHQPWYVAPFSYDIANPKQKIAHHSWRLQSHRHGEHADWYFVYSLQNNTRKEYDIRRGGRSNMPAVWMRLLQQHLSVQGNFHFLRQMESSLAAEGLWQDNLNRTEQTNTRPILPDYRRQQLSLAWANTLPLNRMEWNWGLRLDYNHVQVWTFDYKQQLNTPEFRKFNGQFNMGMHTHLSDAWEWTSSLAWNYRLPAINELYSQGLHHGSGWIEEGLLVDNTGYYTPKSKLRFEQTYRWVNQWVYSKKQHRLSLTPHVSYIQNYVNLEAADLRLTIRGAFPVFRYRQTDVLWAGSDLSWEWQLSPSLKTTHKGSVLWAYDIKRDAGLNQVPPPVYRGAIVWQKAKWGKLSDIQLEFTSEYNGIALSLPHVIAPTQVESQASDTDRAWDFMPPPADYWLFHWRMEGNYGTHWRFSVEVENILNRAYRSYLNRWRYFADDLGRNVSLSVQYMFH